jgi:RNA polymerase sigma-70 factor (ECF subfamily)
MDLVQLETPDAFRLSLAIMRHYFDAEDALQEAFVRAWRELPRLHDPERWQAWFRRIVVSSAIDTGRRKQARRIVPLGYHEPPPMADSSVGLADRDEVMRAVGHLDANDRALLALRFGHDLELPDVAAALGIPLGTAKSRLHRALGRMRKELESVDELQRHREPSSGETECRVKPAPTEPRL